MKRGPYSELPGDVLQSIQNGNGDGRDTYLGKLLLSLDVDAELLDCNVFPSPDALTVIHVGVSTIPTNHMIDKIDFIG
jgi:hypothetical protein